jgi:ribosome maturation factor RimP
LLYVNAKKESAQTLFFVLWRFPGLHGRGGAAREEADPLYAESLEKTVREVVEPLLSGLGYALVDLSIGRLSGSTRINVVIYREEGVGVDECAEVSGMLFPRLETIDALADPSLEVSSPGIDRVLKRPSEYAIFRGRGVRILAGDATEWTAGIIDRVEEETLWLRRGGETRGFAISGIRKARLDYSVEVEETKNAV